MFDYLDWWGYLILGALPGLGFLLGIHWARRHPTPPIPPPAPAEPIQERLLDAVDSVQRQVEELAERQDFAERLLANRRESELKAEPRIPTPV